MIIGFFVVERDPAFPGMWNGAMLETSVLKREQDFRGICETNISGDLFLERNQIIRKREH